MSPYFFYKKDLLFAEEVSLAEVAERYGTPCYVYSRSALENHWHAFTSAFGKVRHRICYAVKANANLAILQIFAKKKGGFDIVSGGELERVLAAKGEAKKIIFSGVGKQHAEIIRAMDVGIGCFNVESEAELERLHTLAMQRKKVVEIALRINPNIDARTHPYIATGLSDNKFGIDASEVVSLCKRIQATLPYCKLIGIACHIGSQLTELSPFMEALDCMLAIISMLKTAGISLQHVDMGGGLGVCYQNETPPKITEYVSALCSKLQNSGLEIIIEPGRALVADAGVLLTRVEYVKSTPHKNFAIVDAGMNDLLRPALYDAWHSIKAVKINQDISEKNYDIVGPVCESADCFGRNRSMALKEGDVLVIDSVGAYGACMSSNYNARPRAAEVMVYQDKIFLVRKRETVQSLFAEEDVSVIG
ncbi:MAG: diaminopimelate decarboxylase [Gammaproteobacteria bacterium]|jgi:diaminopimelate decarboxylase|nr:diaminopimelate decarboxylase [Gammaproteobacteria bacterium]